MKLYDVNLLLAMLSPDHEHHAIAREWRNQCKDKTWATCEITISGFIRLSSNPRIIPKPVLPSEAWNILLTNQRNGNHRYLSFGEEIPADLTETVSRCQGYRQTTDAILVALAGFHQAKLATFDQRLLYLAPDPDWIEVIDLLRRR